MPGQSEVVEWDNLIGSTPLLKLDRLLPDAPFRLYAKLEMCNLGGSMKDRSSLRILKDALEKGAVKPGATIIESSSGNMGIGLAQACKRYGLRFICVVDERTNQQNLKILRALGATLEMVSQTDPAKSLLETRLERVRELLDTIPGSYWTNQYSNPENPASYLPLMSEIDAALDGKIDFLFCATGTCGTIRGCNAYVKKHHLPTTVVAVDAIGSAIFGCKPKPRLIPGHGTAIRPPLFRPGMADEVIHVSDHDCVTGCRELMDTEAILAGGSSGAIVTALQRFAPHIPAGANVVLILGDRGERYLDTIYDDNWVAEHFEQAPIQQMKEVTHAG